jgi:hypothetical protein
MKPISGEKKKKKKISGGNRNQLSSEADAKYQRPLNYE